MVLSVTKSTTKIFIESKTHSKDIDPLHENPSKKKNLLLADIENTDKESINKVNDEKSPSKDIELVSQFPGVDGCALSQVTTDNSMYPILRDKALSIGKLLAMSGSSNSVPHRVRNWSTFDKDQVNFKILDKYGLKYEIMTIGYACC